MRPIRVLLFLLLLFLFGVSCSTESTPVYQLTTSSNPTEGGSVSPTSGEYDEGEKVNITASPNENWVFKDWQGGLSGSENPASVTMNDDKSITALFVKRQYPLTINIEGEGTVSEEVIQQKSTDYPHGTTVELTANPAEGWEFVEWSGDLSDSDNPEEITIDQEKQVTAIFEPIDYLLTTEVQGNGSVKEEIIQSKSTEYAFGTEVKLTAIPEDNWNFDLWTGDLEGNDNPITITIDGETNITANFITTPALKTSSIDNISFETATSSGEITDNGGSEVIERGVCWSSSVKPTLDDSCTSEGRGSGNFTSSLEQLNLGTTYYVRAYAKNKVGVAYGNQLSFKTRDSIEDIDGNNYKVVKIGAQIWMAENLNTRKYRDGSKIINVTDDFTWDRMDVGAWSYYQNSSSMGEIYGKLYNWLAVNDARRICPKGWKVPSHSDWQILENYIDEPFEQFNNGGGKLKETGTKHWKSPNSKATNVFDFTARPGGARLKGSGSSFGGIGFNGFWWSSDSPQSSDDPYVQILFYDSGNILTVFDFSKLDGLSVRCVKN